MKHTVDIAIIGGGAAGLVAAIQAKETNPACTVALIEKEERIGKKLIVTGNGRCNLTNVSGLEGRYFGNVPFAMEAFAQFGVNQTLDWFYHKGIDTVVLEEGKVYPRSLQAGSVVDQLRFALEEKGVTVFYQTQVETIQKGKIFELSTNQGKIGAKQVLVAAGGKGGLKKNQETNGYQLLEALGHRSTPLYPAIVQLTTPTQAIRPLKGIKVEGVVVAKVGETKRREYGEILFTEYGLSGPPVLQVSALFGKAGKGQVSLDLIPDRTFAQIKEEIGRRCKVFANRTCEELLTGFVNKRLGQTVMKIAGVEKLSRLAGSVTPKEQGAIAGLLKNFELPVTGSHGWQQAQVTGGGIQPCDFSSVTMESQLVKGLYVAGELLDVTGDCGGFNLQWAWTSGILAGRAMAERSRML